MSSRPLSFALPLLTLALGCGGDEPRFLSLDRLCPELASDICSARNGGCCAPGDIMACEQAEDARCRAALIPFTSESALRYDSISAAVQRNVAREALDICGPLPVYAAFFEGSLPDGSACERDTLCQSGRCSPETRACVAPMSTPLCSAP